MNLLKIKMLLIAGLVVGVLAVIASGRLDNKDSAQQATSESLADDTAHSNMENIVITEASTHSAVDKPAKIPSKINAQLERRYKTLSDNANYPTLESRLQAMSERTNKTYEPEAVLNAMAERNAWAQTGTPPKTIPMKDIELQDGREFIAVNQLKIETLMPGDSLSLPVAQKHAVFDINIVSVDKNPNGSFTWHGEIKRNNESYFVEITQSEHLTLAGISTPDGNFALQANGGEGWLATTDTLFKRDEHVSDALIPPDTISPPSSQQ